MYNFQNYYFFLEEKCEDEATWPTSYYLNEAELGA